MGHFRTAILDFFFPPHCIYCDKIVASSDEPVCPKCANEMPWVSDDEPLVKGKHFTVCAAAGWYRDALREAFRAYKFRGHTEHAKTFGNALARSIRLQLDGRYDLITWLPVSPERRKERGFDQSLLLAEAAAKCLEQPLRSTLAKAHTGAQSSMESAQARVKNIRGAFTVIDPALVSGKRVLLIDDLITSGSTMNEAAAALREAGAAEVLGACFARAARRDEPQQD